MKRIFITCLIALSAMTTWAQVNYNVVPLPRSVELSAKGETFNLIKGVAVTCTPDNEEMARNAQFAKEYLGGGVKLELGLKNANPDAYQIVVNKKGVTITGATESGVFRGIQTLRKAIGTTKGDTIALPYVTINDEPRFEYRGVMLDCARHFFPVEFIKKYLDIMALHGCNNFHWHITDDQGWRFEVKSMPMLTEAGSVRRQTVIGHNCGIYDGQEYGHGMYYSQEECREIIKYAAERYINVIPEIDLPGHMVAALHVYPELGCTGGPYHVLTYWGVSNDVLCAGNPKTLEFLKKVLSEVAEVFPSKIIHIGGDESPRTRWAKCDKCQAKMKELGLTKEAELQTYINKELETFMSAKGRTLLGWDETLEGGLSEQAWVMSWRGYDGGRTAARLHHHVIMTPTQNCYIDYYQLKNTHAQPLSIGGYLPLSKVYEMEPIPSDLTKEEAKYIMGAQCNLWTEYIGAPEHAMYMLLPRLAAMSEVQWTLPEQKNFENFETRLPQLQNLYQALGYKYCRKYE